MMPLKVKNYLFSISGNLTRLFSVLTLVSFFCDFVLQDPRLTWLSFFLFLLTLSSLYLRVSELRKKFKELEAWVQVLGEVSSQITAGDYATHLPASPPKNIFRKLTSNM